MKSSKFAVGLCALAFGSLASCSSSSDSDSTPGGGDSGAGRSSAGSGASTSGDAGEAGESSSAGGSGNAGRAGAGNGAGSNGEAGAGPTAGEPLPAGTFLYVRSETADHDTLIARDFATGAERVVTDLTEDGSDGWEIWGHTVSPNRTRIVFASLVGPTKADNDTGLATRRLWSIAADGSDPVRLTPVFPNDGGTRKQYQLAVDSPAFTADGSAVIFDFGSWWYEGTKLQGGTFPWAVSASGSVPEPFPSITTCSVLQPSVNPATGEVLFVHSVCINAADEGIFLYPPNGGTAPTKLVARFGGPLHIDPSLETASWAADGSGFLFTGTIDVGAERASALLIYDSETGEVTPVVTAEPDTYVRSATVSADATRIVYCLDHGDAYDLHAIDLTLAEPVDQPITDDGKSCAPGF